MGAKNYTTLTDCVRKNWFKKSKLLGSIKTTTLNFDLGITLTIYNQVTFGIAIKAES